MNVRDDSISLKIANQYIRRGWKPVPIPYKTKAPCGNRWQLLRINATDAPLFFDEPEQNIGVLLGKASGGLVDVDLDCAEALELADKFLPPTQAVFGRHSKRRSHWLYYVKTTIKTTRHKFRDGKNVICELRSDRAQTVFPGSVHPSGENIKWAPDGKGEPAEVDGAARRAVERLARECKKKRGESPTQNRTAPAAGVVRAGKVNAAESERLFQRARDYVAAIRPPAEGSRDCTLFNVAGHLWAMRGDDGGALSETQIVGLVRGLNILSSSPLPDQVVVEKVRSAEKNGTPRQIKYRGPSRRAAESMAISLAQGDQG